MNEAIFKELSAECPEAVMVRVVLENTLTPELVDQAFDDHRKQQYTRSLLFSSVVKLAQLVVCRVRPSMNAAFKLMKDELCVSQKSLYNKLNNTEPSVCEGLVRVSSERMRAIIDELNVDRQQLIRGFDTRIVDGNHLAATQHRIKELRTTGSGPLPGKSLVVWDAERQMVHNVYCCEDGHAQERSIFPELLNDIQPNELWIGDRNIATSSFVWQVRASKARFIVRRHQRNIRFVTRGRERRVGETKTGTVYEQSIEIHDDFGGTFRARKIRIVLNQPTRDKEQEIELLTNLPERVQSLKIADAYLERWQIEVAFYELDKLFEGEIEALGHPRAALLMFCLSLLAYNALNVVRAALAAAHGVEKADQISGYYFTHLVNGDWRALEIFASTDDWAKKFSNCTPAQIARILLGLAKKVDLRRLKKSKRGPKKQPPKRTSNKRRPHVSTARVLQARKAAR